MNGNASRTWAEIRLGQVRRNYQAIHDAVGSAVTLAPVVKANAYGHGAEAIARTLEEAGAGWFAVSCAAEGAALREAGVRSRILVMGGLLPFEREAVWNCALTPVVHSLAELAAWDSAGRELAVHLKIDTGMSRLGVTAEPAETVAAVRSLRHVRLEGLMSHFASAEDFSTPQTAEQTGRFAAVQAALHEAGVHPRFEHFCSTSGIAYRRQAAELSLVRPGLATYGYLPAPLEGPAPRFTVSPVLHWFARLLNTRTISPGTTVGYRARFTAPVAMRIGTVAAGYADGVPHRLSTRGSFVHEGRMLPILGAVSMDLTTVDLSAAPDLQAGDAVTVMGPGMDARQIAEIAGEISYSVLCGIGNRVDRVYRDD